MLSSSIIAQESRGTDNEILQMRIYNLLKSKESRSKAKERFKHQQEVVKHWFDKHKAGNKEFKAGDLVLKWDCCNLTDHIGLPIIHIKSIHI